MVVSPTVLTVINTHGGAHGQGVPFNRPRLCALETRHRDSQRLPRYSVGFLRDLASFWQSKAAERCEQRTQSEPDPTTGQVDRTTTVSGEIAPPIGFYPRQRERKPLGQPRNRG